MWGTILQPERHARIRCVCGLLRHCSHPACAQGEAKVLKACEFALSRVGGRYDAGPVWKFVIDFVLATKV